MGMFFRHALFRGRALFVLYNARLQSLATGRKGQSDEVKAAKGNPGRRPLNGETGEKSATKAVPLPPVTDATPAYLSADGKRIWARVAPHLGRMYFFRSTDHEGLARYCENLKNWWACERRIRRLKSGPIYETNSKHGKARVSSINWPPSRSASLNSVKCPMGERRW